MKLLIAYIQPHALEAVKEELSKRDIAKMSVTNSLGCGAQMGYHENYRGVEFDVNLLKKVRLEIAVNDEFVEAAVESITKAARTGEIGDGKIFIIHLEECIRIRTGQKGPEAIG
ncbi:P-II family nitrogen regulator [Sedimentisphaera salicampi]|uniref:Nitrogen regulatory protein P-II n=1 Tax=Sedimentisphaera salicampi TaxID=1941349 RepID=A0A1W6LMZ7_9BACT|nr:Nitrogen regulatory protein P-II [Sedimentisphaera salicampi]OXU14751.1 Nitrogen regulatory protein P-II [Sedimentisphaera salicampi]